MGWEDRNGNLYYYQSERDKAGKVKKRYIGTGGVAEFIAHADQTRQRVREARRRRGREELEHMHNLMASAFELEEAVDVLVRAHLVAAGCHRHKGVWRRGRNSFA